MMPTEPYPDTDRIAALPFLDQWDMGYADGRNGIKRSCSGGYDDGWDYGDADRERGSGPVVQMVKLT